MDYPHKAGNDVCSCVVFLTPSNLHPALPKRHPVEGRGLACFVRLCLPRNDVILVGMEKMNDSHIKIFEKSIPEVLDKECWVGSDVNSWWDWVSKELSKEEKHKQIYKHVLPKMPYNEKRQFSRKILKNICKKDSGYDDLDCLIAVMAWGGQNRKYGAILLKRFDEIKPIISDMRNGKLNPYDAYQKFDKIWKGEDKLGMGAAYFTKLIFFCEPSHKGYIMDQWTSKSVNLLSGKEIVHLNYGYVSKLNTFENYKNFCDYVDKLGRDLKYSGEEIEQSLFSRGGSNKWAWRDHVFKEYPKFQSERKKAA